MNSPLRLAADPLDIFLTDNAAPLLPPSPRNPPLSAAKRTDIRPKMWHDDLIDELLLNPTWTHAELGAKLGRTKETIGYVLRSDTFRMRYEERRAEHSTMVSAAIIASGQRIAHKAMTGLEKAIDNDIHGKIAPQTLNEIAKTALATIGLAPQKGTNGSPAITINQTTNHNHVDINDLNAARQRIAQQGAILEATTESAPRAPRGDFDYLEHQDTGELSDVGETSTPIADVDGEEGREAPLPRGEGEGA